MKFPGRHYPVLHIRQVGNGASACRESARIYMQDIGHMGLNCASGCVKRGKFLLRIFVGGALCLLSIPSLQAASIRLAEISRYPATFSCFVRHSCRQLIYWFLRHNTMLFQRYYFSWIGCNRCNNLPASTTPSEEARERQSLPVAGLRGSGWHYPWRPPPLCTE